MQQVEITITTSDHVTSIASKAGFSEPVEGETKDNVIAFPGCKIPKDIDEGLQHIIEAYLQGLLGAGYTQVTGVAVEIDNGETQWTNAFPQ